MANLNIKPISDEQVRINNILCGRQGVFASQINGQKAQFTLLPLVQLENFEVTLFLRMDNKEVPFQVNRSFFATCKIGDTVMMDVIENLSGPLLLGSCHIIFERILNDFRSVLQKDIQIHKVVFEPVKLQSALALSIEFNGAAHSGQIGVSSEHLSLLEKLPIVSTNDALQNTPLTAILEVGRTVLSSQQVNTLQLQDIVFFEKNWYQDRSHIFLKLSENNGFMVKIENQMVTVENRMEVPMSDDDLDDALDDLDDDLDDFLDDDEEDEGEKEQVKPSSTAQTTNASSGKTDIGSMPVSLTFEIGRQEILFKNMNQLVPGFSFQLNRPIANPVIIYANGNALAEGELIDVNGQLGTRITKIL